MGSAESKLVENRLFATSVRDAKMPNSFNVYFDMSSPRLRVNLGPNKDETHLVASLPSGRSSILVLHDGPTLESDPLALVKPSSKLGTAVDIITGPLQPRSELVRHQMRDQLKKRDISYAFEAPVGADLMTETFEWRGSKSDEVKELDNASRGWKLVRVSDGQVFAVWTWNTLSASVRKTASFRFTESALAKDVGPLCKIIVVASFLRIWQKDMEAMTSASGG